MGTQTGIQKIAVIGNAGGGKTTLSRRLAVLHELPLTHVDAIQFLPGMKIRPHKESIAIITEIQAGPAWIIDGYGPLDILEKRLASADQIILIDFPLWRHFWWAGKRQLISLWSPRRELPDGCTDTSWAQTRKLFQNIRRVHKLMRPELLRILSREHLRPKLIHIKTYQDWQNVYQGLPRV